MTDPICAHCKRPRSEHVTVAVPHSIYGVAIICPTAQFEAAVVDDACADCDGTGSGPTEPCQSCGGTGSVIVGSDWESPFAPLEPCPRCKP